MTTPEENYAGPAGTPANHHADQPEAARAPRCTDWITYAVTVTQPAPPDRADLSDDSTL